MLHELKQRAPAAGEREKRWFFCHEIDLVFWIDTQGNPCGFQLSYDKYKNEKSISWSIERGYHHFLVDDGEALPNQKSTPVLYEIDGFDKNKVLALFNSHKGDVPDAFASFLQLKLNAYTPN